MLDKLVKFQQVTGVLQAAGIPFIPLKGFLLSHRIYGDPTYRITGDIDLLVSQDQAHQAIQVLLQKGFEPLKFDWPKSKRREKSVFREMN